MPNNEANRIKCEQCGTTMQRISYWVDSKVVCDRCKDKHDAQVLIDDAIKQERWAIRLGAVFVLAVMVVLNVAVWVIARGWR